MSNPLYQQLNKQSSVPTQGRMMNPMERIQLIQRISRDPKNFMEEALKKGDISQEWIDQNMPRAKELQSQLVRMFGR